MTDRTSVILLGRISTLSLEFTPEQLNHSLFSNDNVLSLDESLAFLRDPGVARDVIERLQKLYPRTASNADKIEYTIGLREAPRAKNLWLGPSS